MLIVGGELYNYAPRGANSGFFIIGGELYYVALWIYIPTEKWYGEIVSKLVLTGLIRKVSGLDGEIGNVSFLKAKAKNISQLDGEGVNVSVLTAEAKECL